MARLIAEMLTEHAGEVLCGELLRQGLDPVRLEVMPGGGEAVIMLSIIDSWSKAVKLPRDRLEPAAVYAALEVWKAKVREDIASNRPSEVIKAAIRRFGSERVELALKPRHV